MLEASDDVAALVVALAFAAMGITAFVRPASIGRYFGTAITTVDGRNEIRAVYGGFGIAMALGLSIALRVPSLRPGIFACVALALAGMAIGRLASAAIERPGRWPWVFFFVEAFGALSLSAGHFTVAG